MLGQGIDARYLLTSERTKLIMGAFFFVIVVGWFGGLGSHGWFWLLTLFGGLPWLGAVSNYFHTIWCRAAYNAALDDAAWLIGQNEPDNFLTSIVSLRSKTRT